LPTLRGDILREAERHTRAGVIRLGNPMDLGDIFDLDFYFSVVDAALRQENIHGIVFIHVSHMVSEQEATRRLIEKLGRLSEAHGKPVAVVVEVPLEERALLEKTADFPFFLDPTDAVQGLEVLHRYGSVECERATNGGPLTEDNLPRGVAGWTERFARENRQPLLHEALTLLDMIGVSTVPWQMTTSREEALSAATEMGYPVALKAVSHSLLHKSDNGGIALNVGNPKRLEAEWHKLQAVSADLAGIVVRKMVSASRELIVGAKRDPTFGPMVLIGMGGITVEFLKDVNMRLAPVGIAEALEMLSQLQGRKILGDFRGMKEADLRSVAEVVVQISRLIHGFPQVREIDINSMSVDGKGNRVVALDARVLVAKSS
jgi:acetate---CoA ligase (ADP-forming)